MMITPLTKAINRRNEWIVGGCNSKGKEKRERERERERGVNIEKEGEKCLHWVP